MVQSVDLDRNKPTDTAVNLAISQFSDDEIQ